MCLCLRSRLLYFAMQLLFASHFAIVAIRHLFRVYHRRCERQVSWFVGERPNRQQQCVSIHSHHFSFSFSRSLSIQERRKVMSLLWFCYSVLCGNSSNLVEWVKDVKNKMNSCTHKCTVTVRASVKERCRALHKRAYIKYINVIPSKIICSVRISLAHCCSPFFIVFFLIRPSPSLEWHTRGFSWFFPAYCFMHTYYV